MSNPQLAAFSGFHGSTSSLHRAAAAGHLDVCRAVVGLIQRKIAEADAPATREGGGGGGGGARGARRRKVPGMAPARRWRSLLRTVLDQRTHRGKTPLMLACEQG